VKKIKEFIEHHFLRKDRKGFTLIELLVVIAIIGVLSSAAFVVLGPARKKSRDSKRKADFRQINTAMEICYTDSNCGGGIDEYPNTTQGANTLTSIGTLIAHMPLDIIDTSPYQYTWTEGDSEYYCLYIKLEALSDTWLCSSKKGVFPKTSVGYTPTNSDCCGADVTL